MRLLLLVTAGMAVMAAAQPQCDPLTQYESGGDCCEKCRPGYRMSSPLTCRDPQCKECDENDYQDSYTTESQCKRQPYCDPNKNVEAPAHSTKTQRSSCVCREGFHCSGVACLTCAQHTRCQPGQWVARKGNATHDALCRRCPEETFSNETNADTCKEWTKCESTKQRGTETSDSVCEPDDPPRQHLVLVAVLGVVCIVAVIAIVGFILYRGRRGITKGEFSIKTCLGGDGPQPVKLVAANNFGADDDVRRVYVQEEVGSQTPEENEVEPFLGTSLVTSPEMSLEPSLDMPSNPNLTVNGKYVMQENDNPEKLSRQESQT